MLGVGFLVGLLSTTPDLQSSVSSYYIQNNISDIEMKSSMGFSDGDASYLKNKYDDYIESIISIKQEDKVLDVNGEETTSRIFYMPVSHSDMPNKLTLENGSWPRSKDECVAEVPSIYISSVSLGSYIIDGSSSYKITGLVSSPLFLSKEKEHSQEGNGHLGAILYFDSAYYQNDDSFVLTDIYINLYKASDVNMFANAYQKKVDSFKEKLTGEEEYLLEERSTDIKQKAYSEAYEAIYTEYENQAKSALISQGLSGDELDMRLSQVMSGLESTIEAKAEEEAESSMTGLDSKIYIFDLQSNLGYSTFKIYAEKVEDISFIFPLFFIMIAALVTLTSITRMIEKDRGNMGLMKALGYSKKTITFSYLLYSLLSSGLGALLGTASGIFFLPYIIYQVYLTTFFMPTMQIMYETGIITIVTMSLILLVLLVTFVIIKGTLKEKPSSLMLGKAPKPGKKILLERMPVIWNRLKFKYKSTFKNILRYKKNLFMMILGISGCTALLLAGFGINDSMGAVTDEQYNDIFGYQLVINVNSMDENPLISIDGISSYERVNIEQDVTANNEDSSLSLTLFAGEDNENNNLSHYVSFQDMSGKDLDYGSNSVFLTDMAAKYLGLSNGDDINIDIGNGSYDFKITGITKNYVQNYIYMSLNTYRNVVSDESELNSYLVKGDFPTSSEDDIAKNLTDLTYVTNVEFISQTKASFAYLIDSMKYIVLVIILFSGALSMVVTYNLTDININERTKEIATLKVLGYRRNEVASYIYRETRILTFLGILIGLGLGFLMHWYIIYLIDSPALAFGNSIKPLSYLWTFLLSWSFSEIVNMIFRPILRKIKMAESLKSMD